MASNEWLVRKLHEQDKKIEALSRGGTGVGHTSIAPGENLTVISDNGEVVLGAGGIEHVDGPTPATPSAPTLKLGFGTIEVTWDGTFAEGEDEDGVPLTAPVDFDVVEVHCSTDPEEEEWGDDTRRGQIKTREGGTVTVGGFDVDDEVFVCLIALAKTGKRSAPSATASLTIEGLDFSQLFTEIDAANATIKNAGEVLVTEQDTLNDKLSDAFGQIDDIVANGSGTKNFYTPTMPAEGMREGDLWFDPSDSNKPYIFQDGEWITVRDSFSPPGAGENVFALFDEAGTTKHAIDNQWASVPGFTFTHGATGVEAKIPDGATAGTATVRLPLTGTFNTAGEWQITAEDTIQSNGLGLGGSGLFEFYSPGAAPTARIVLGVAVPGMDLLEIVQPLAVKEDKIGSTRTHSMYLGDQNLQTIGIYPSVYAWSLFLEMTVDSVPGNTISGSGQIAYAVGGKGIVDKAITTEKIATGAITAESGIIGSLDLGTLTAGSAAIKEAVINKLFSDVVVAKMAVAEQFIGENAILTGAVTAPKITASEELWAKIGQFVKIRAEHIEADAIDGKVITGATIRSAATGARTQMSASGFEAYDNTGKRTFFASASTGEVSITGKLFTGDPGFSRVALDPTLWSNLPVYNDDGTVAGYANGAGVRVGIDASNSLDMYHAGISGSVRSGVIRGPGGLAKIALNESIVLVSGENADSVSSSSFGGRFRAKAQDKVDSNQYSLINESTLSVDISTSWGAAGDSSGVSTNHGSARLNCTDQGKYSSVVASGGSLDLKTYYGGFDTSWLRLTGSDTAGSTYIDVSAEHINPLRINYAGTGDSWIIPFRKSGTAWGYIGSSGAMGVDEFGIQSAAGKNLKLQTTSSSDSVLLNGGGADITLLYDGGPKVRSNTIATTVGSPGSAASGAVYIRTASGNMFVSSSSKRYKTNISDAKELPRLLDVSVRTWQDKADVELAERLKKFREETGEGPVPQSLSDAEVDAPRSFGAVAEEVDELGLSELVRYDAYGRPDGLHYEMFGVALIPEIRKLRDRITELERLTNE